MLTWHYYAAAAAFVVLTLLLARAQRQPEDKEGYVYFIGGRASGPIKIGVTTASPEERMKDLQTGSAVRLHLHGAFIAVEDLYDTEGRIHNALADYHVGGEWYAREPSLTLMRELLNQSRQTYTVQ